MHNMEHNDPEAKDETGRQLRVLRALEHVSKHLPSRLHQQQVKISRTSHVVPYIPRSSSNAACRPVIPNALYPINIVLMKRDVLENSFSEGPQLVCESFGLTLCCISATVNDDFSFEFKSSHGACEALRNKTLELRSSVFGDSYDPVGSGMMLILKYLERGFTWPSVHAASTCACAQPSTL